MFSLTRIAAAGVIMALLGGNQTSTPQVQPSIAEVLTTTAASAATSVVAPSSKQAVASGLDGGPAVLEDYAYTSVEPGVWRLERDSLGRDVRRWDVVVASDGRVWGQRNLGTEGRPRQAIVEFGEPGRVPIPGGLKGEKHFGIFGAGTDTVMAGCACDLGKRMFRLGGDTWAEVPGTDDWLVTYGPDGTPWKHTGDESRSRIGQYEPHEGWRWHDFPVGVWVIEAVGDAEGRAWALEIAGPVIDGQQQPRPENGGAASIWLMRGEGDSWHRIRMLLDHAPDGAGGSIHLARDGSLTAIVAPDVVIRDPGVDPNQVLGSVETVATRVVGDHWTTVRLPLEASRSTVAPDGSLWFVGYDEDFRTPSTIVRYRDGMLGRYTLPARGWNDRPAARVEAVSDDGTVWLAVQGHTDDGRSRPDGLYVVDPSAAEPISTEAIDVRSGSLDTATQTRADVTRETGGIT